MKKHSEKHVVSPEDISEAEAELNDQGILIGGAIQKLNSLRKELSPLDHNNTDTELSALEINQIVDKSERVMENIATKLIKLYLEEDSWNVLEESKIIQSRFSSEVRENLKNTMSKNGDISYPSKNNDGLRVSLNNAGIILKKIKQEKSLREMEKYRAKGKSPKKFQYDVKVNKTTKHDTNSLEDAEEWSDDEVAALEEETSSERHVDLALIAFFVLIMISILALLTISTLKKGASSPDIKYPR